jgi:hypothetical protein
MPEFSNRQVVVTATGLALHNREAVYAAMIGPKGSLKSIWAGLVMNTKSPVTYAPGWHWSSFKAAVGSKQFWAALPRANSHHLVVRSLSANLVLITDPAAAALYGTDRATSNARRDRLPACMPEAYAALAAYLEAYEFTYQGEPARLPLLAHWAPVLWDQARNTHAGSAGYGIWSLDAWGDCLAAFWINPAYPWINLIQELIKAGKLIW